MNKKQDMVEKDSFRQAGEDLLRKVREEERADLRLALSSWQKLEERLNAPRKTSVLRIRYLVSSVAAAVMLLLAVGCYFWMMGHDKSSLPLALLEEKNVGALPGDEILLVKDQGWVQLKDEATVIYDTVGKSNVEEHQIEKNEQETKIDEPDQIIVPKGRRANIVFSDGTKMYINAETRVIFPTVFAKDKREILVDGEVYLEVAADPSRPFIVKTSTIEVKVLGTRFNVCAYRDEPAASVVLVEGQVEVKNGDNGKNVLSPDDMLELKGKEISIKKVDVFEHICWKDNLMLLNDRKVGEVLNRLSRYYGRTILFGKEIGEIPISGKLDLRENLEEVVEIICQSLFLRQERDGENNVILLK